MQYTWDSKCAFEMAAVPKAAAEQLKLTSALQLRVLMWLCCVGGGEFDANAAAVACGGSPELCEEALEYWVARGLIVLKDGADPSGETTVPPVVRPAALPVSQRAAVEPTDGDDSPAVIAYPTRQQALNEKANNADFSEMLDAIAAKLGKVLSPSDMILYLYLYKDVKMPAEVLLMIVGYAVKNGKARSAYIKQTALSWAENGIMTFEAADAYLSHIERCDAAWDQVKAACSLAVERPTVAQKEAAFRWVYEWKMPYDVIVYAVAYALEKTDGKFQSGYADRVIERLHAAAVTTVEKAKEELESPKKSTKRSASRMKTDDERKPSFDLDGYEQLARRHRPKAKKQED